MSLPFGESVLIQAPVDRDRFGDRPATPLDPVQVDGVGFAFETTSAAWPQDAEDRGLAEATLFLPKTAVVVKGAVITRLVDGTTWHLVGSPQWNGSVQPMTGWDAGMFTQRIRRVT